MITLSDNIFPSLGLPLDARLSNVIIDGANIIVESKEDYLIRVDIDSRHVGMEVFFVSPVGIYPIPSFMSSIQDGTILSVTYKFNTSTSDEGFEVYSGGSGGSGHIIKDENGVVFPDRPILKIKGSVIEDNEDESSTDVTPATTENITSFGVGDIGGIDEGDVVLEGSTLNDVIKKLLQASIPVEAPSASVTLSPSSTQEVGDVIDITVTPGFVKRDGGDLNQVVIKRGGISLITQASLTPYLHASQIIVLGNNQYISEISYNEGIADPQKTGIIPAGTVTGSRSLVGAYKN